MRKLLLTTAAVAAAIGLAVAVILLFVVCNNNVEFMCTYSGRITQGFDDSSFYYETILVKNMPKNKIEQSKTMIAYFDSVGFTINTLSRMSGIKYYSMDFYKSTSATIGYFVKGEPDLYKYNANKTYFGAVTIMRCKSDSTKWSVQIIRNLGTARDYEHDGPDLSRTILLNGCRSYIHDDEKNDELLRYYMELRNKKKNKSNK